MDEAITSRGTFSIATKRHPSTALDSLLPADRAISPRDALARMGMS
jgi:hypothetical protein